MKHDKFAHQTGKEWIPIAERIEPERLSPAKRFDPGVEDWRLRRLCITDLRQGCYKVTVTRRKHSLLTFCKWEGTLRVDTEDGGITISGDLYRPELGKLYGKVLDPRATLTPAEGKAVSQATISLDVLGGYLNKPRRRTIPVYKRSRYYAYLACTAAHLNTLVYPSENCKFSLDFDLYEYEHPDDGFDGSFPDTFTKQVKLAMEHTTTADRYLGTMFEGATVLGSVTMEWVSSSFRKANLDVHTLSGSEAPQEVDDIDGTGTEDFRSAFASSGWNLRVAYRTPNLTIPSSISSSQDGDDCWSRENSHILMESISGYDAGVLDRKWLVRLMAIEGKLGCSRGRMFDNRIKADDYGDLNLIAREGAVTYSDDGYDDAAFGDNEDDLQKDTPRAFLRSAVHEVGHAFNLVHPTAGNQDNSIMTTSPGVAGALNTDGLDFPEDISLEFRDSDRHHLVHKPDPVVRPGAMSFPRLDESPETDDEVAFLDPADLHLKVTARQGNLKLGQPLHLSWRATNRTRGPLMLPLDVSDRSMVARVSVTSSDGTIRYIKPVQVDADLHLSQAPLAAGKSRKASSVLFWNRDGFVFKTPGSYRIDVILLWKRAGVWVGTRGSTIVWVSYPVSKAENEWANQMFHKHVGIYVAFDGKVEIPDATRRIRSALKVHKSHPGNATLRSLRKVKAVRLPGLRKQTKPKRK